MRFEDGAVEVVRPEEVEAEAETDKKYVDPQVKKSICDSTADFWTGVLHFKQVRVARSRQGMDDDVVWQGNYQGAVEAFESFDRHREAGTINELFLIQVPEPPRPFRCDLDGVRAGTRSTYDSSSAPAMPSVPLPSSLLPIPGSLAAPTLPRHPRVLIHISCSSLIRPTLCLSRSPRNYQSSAEYLSRLCDANPEELQVLRLLGEETRAAQEAKAIYERMEQEYYLSSSCLGTAADPCAGTSWLTTTPSCPPPMPTASSGCRSFPRRTSERGSGAASPG
eukprot:751789-Hanusia_phi.AAC.4